MAIMKPIAAKLCECIQCGYSWSRRGTQTPKCCPRCKRYDWQKRPKTMEVTKMTKTIAAIVLLGGLLMPVQAASFIPAKDTRAAMAPKLIDVRERAAAEIAARTSYGYHYAAIDMDGADWKTENVIMKELQAQGYKVDYCNDRHVFGWNAINGGLLVKW